MSRFFRKTLIFLILISSNVFLFAQNDTIILFDTVYLPADTIKNVDTIFVYEEVDAISKTSDSKNNKKKKKKRYEYSIGPSVGINPSLDYFMTGGMHFNWQYKHFFTQLSLSYNSAKTKELSYTRQFSKTEEYIDTVETLVEEFIEIIGDDTTTISIYEYDYIEKTRTIYSDSSYAHTNTYRSLILPITAGFCKKTRKLMIGIAAGVQLRMMLPSKSNKYIDNNSFIPEDSFLRPINIDAVVQASSMQKITKKVWMFETIGMSIPLMSDIESSKSKIYTVQANLNIGLQYYFNR